MLGLYRDNGKENGNYWGYIGVILTRTLCHWTKARHPLLKPSSIHGKKKRGLVGNAVSLTDWY